MKEYKLETNIESIQDGYEKTINEYFYSHVPASDEFSLTELYTKVENEFAELVKNLKEDGICSLEFTLPSILLKRQTKKRITKDKKGHLSVEELLSRTSTYYYPTILKTDIVNMLNLLSIKYNCYIKTQYEKDCYENIDETTNNIMHPHTIITTLYDEKSYLKLFQEALINFKNTFDKMINDYQKGYLNISYSRILEEASKSLNEIKLTFNGLPSVDSMIEELGFKLSDKGKILVLKRAE